MTTEELDALEPGRALFIPDGFEVSKWRFGGRAHDSPYFLLSFPADEHGVVSRKRPLLVREIELLHATTDEVAAWQFNIASMERQITDTKRFKLPPENQTDTTL